VASTTHAVIVAAARLTELIIVLPGGQIRGEAMSACREERKEQPSCAVRLATLHFVYLLPSALGVLLLSPFHDLCSILDETPPVGSVTWNYCLLGCTVLFKAIDLAPGRVVMLTVGSSANLRRSSLSSEAI